MRGRGEHGGIAPGSVSIIPAGLPSLWRWTGRPRTAHFRLPTGLTDRVVADRGGDGGRSTASAGVFGLASPEIAATLDAIRAEAQSGRIGDALCVEALGTLLAVQVVRRLSGEDGRRPRPRGVLSARRMRAIEAYAEDHLDGPNGLADLAAVAHLSVHHFARAFKRTTGLPPHAWLVARRVERAKRLLGEGGGSLSLAQVAARAGFSDESHLIRRFRRAVGVTPGEYR